MSAGVLPDVIPESSGASRRLEASEEGVLVVSWGTPSDLVGVLRGQGDAFLAGEGRVVGHVIPEGAPFAAPAHTGLLLVDARSAEEAATAWVVELVRARPDALVVACVSVGARGPLGGARTWLERGCVAILPVADADPALPEILGGLVARLGAGRRIAARLHAVQGALETMRDGRFRVTSPEQVACLGAWFEASRLVEGPDPAGVVELLRGTLELRSRGRDSGRAIDLCFHRSGQRMDVSIASDAAFSSSARAGWSLEETRLFHADVLAPWEREQVVQAVDRVLEESRLDTAGGWVEVARFLAGQLGSETVVLGRFDERGRWSSLGAVGVGDLALSGDADGPRRAGLADVFRPITREGRPLLCNRPVGRPSFQRPWRRVAGVPFVRGGETSGTLHVANRATDYGDRDLAKMFLVARRLAPFLALASELEVERTRRTHAERLLAVSGKRAFELEADGQVVYEGAVAGGEAILGKRLVADVPALAPLGPPLVEAIARVGGSGHAALWEGPSQAGASTLVRLTPLPEGRVAAFLDLSPDNRQVASQDQRFFELSLDMLALVEGERLVRVNEAFVDVVGWKDGELLGRAVAELIHPDDRGAFLSLLRGLGEGAEPSPERQARVLTRAGLVRVVEWRATQHQASTYLVGRDVTEERRALERLATQHAELSRQHRDTVEDHAIARRVLAGVIREGCLDAPFIAYSLSPLAVFNGDVALAAELPDGSLRWFLGDFAGHGLSGAIGTIPLASTFHATARKGVSLAETLVTLNDSLRSILPPWLFCAGALIELDPTGTRLSVWNAGLPAVIVRHLDGSLVRLGSRHAPLGILEAQEFATSAELVAVEAGDRVVVFSDGLVEAKRRDGREWGLPAIEAVLGDAPPNERLMDQLLRGLEAFRDGAPRSDDTSLVEVVVGPGPRLRSR